MRLAAFACLVLVLAATPGATAVAADSTTAPRTCLVLGGGGARGTAHIGVLKVLEREHIAIDCIAGTSMGAIVGGMYASGYDSEQIVAALDGINWRDTFRDDPSREDLPMRRKEDDLRFVAAVELGLKDGRIAFPRGAIQGQKLQLILRRLLLSVIGVDEFDALPIPFRAIATDIGRGEKVVFARGDLALAIRASMSVPGAIAPMRIDGRLLVDGGITDNLPIDAARDMGATRIIAVDVSAVLAPDDKLNSPFAIANQMLTALMRRQTDAQIATLGADDLLIRPDLGDLGSADFDQAQRGVAIGEAAAEAALPQLRRYAVDAERYAAFQARHRTRPFDAPLIAFLDVQRNRSRTAGYVDHRLSPLVGQPFDVRRTEHEIGRAFGEGSYERITYTLERRGDETGLLVVPVDKGWGPNFLRAGLRLSDDFAGRNGYQLTGEANFTGLNQHGGEWRNRVELGRITGLHSELRQPFGSAGQFHVSPYFDYSAFNFPLRFGGHVDVAQYRLRNTTAAFELGYSPSPHWQFGATLEYIHSSAQLKIGTDIPGIRNDLGGLQLRLTHDSLDSGGFPSRGTRLDLSHDYLPHQLSSGDTANLTRLRWDHAWSPTRSDHLLFGLRGNLAHGGADFVAAYSPLGGLGNLSGYTEYELFARQTLLARTVYYHRLTDASALFSVPVYLGGSLEAGGLWNEPGQVRLGDMAFAGSLFLGMDTPLGPMFLGYGHAQGSHNAFYLTFGSLLRPDH